MTPEERERIEAAVREAVKSITGFSDGPLVPQLLAKFHEHLTPAIDALLASRDQRIAELEGLLRESQVKMQDNCGILPRNLLHRIDAALRGEPHE